jgi:hypothetical protein
MNEATTASNLTLTNHGDHWTTGATHDGKRVTIVVTPNGGMFYAVGWLDGTVWGSALSTSPEAAALRALAEVTTYEEEDAATDFVVTFGHGNITLEVLTSAKNTREAYQNAVEDLHAEGIFTIPFEYSVNLA